MRRISAFLPQPDGSKSLMNSPRLDREVDVGQRSHDRAPAGVKDSSILRISTTE
jgi:hypothetical protein